jgi:protein-tyrosine phosphatase
MENQSSPDLTIASTSAKSRQLLFLCSGNYYRSRFAEILFNYFATRTRLNWQAFSRGLVADRENGNEGPISAHTLLGLQARGIPVPQPLRFPLQLEEEELEVAELVIAVKEAEHRPLVKERFPQWVGGVEYWHVDDLDCASPEETLAELERQVRALLDRLTTCPVLDKTLSGPTGGGA